MQNKAHCYVFGYEMRYQKDFRFFSEKISQLARLTKKTGCQTVFRIRPQESHDAPSCICIRLSRDSSGLKIETSVTYRGRLSFSVVLLTHEAYCFIS